MAKSFFFYDLETSGLDPREDRIMQFAGQRTDENFQPVGDPYNLLVEMKDDTLPAPSALMVTGITPQKTLEEGYSEPDFCKILIDQVFTPDTTVVGFNNIRFDDEFIRYTLWRNFYDPYEWAYKDGRSRWDLLDVARMTRALRPEGIVWPVDSEGRATNRLELLTEANGIDHRNAHDALSDVSALIAVTELIHNTQPKLFDYLYQMRDKNAVKRLVNLDDRKPFVYVSGRYDSQFNKATVAVPVAPAPNGNVMVYDLRYDPSEFLELDENDLAKKIFASHEERKAEDFVPLPVKVLQYNRCPAVAPLGVLNEGEGWHLIGINSDTVERNRAKLFESDDFARKLEKIFANQREFKKSDNPEAQLYDGFIDGRDKLRAESVRQATPDDIASLKPNFDDARLKQLFTIYRARNFPRAASNDERASYDQFRHQRLETQLKSFLPDLERQHHREDLSDHQKFVLEELKLWLESLVVINED